MNTDEQIPNPDPPDDPAAAEAAARAARVKTLISAARRVQGARSRRTTAARDLFEACAEVRRKVKERFRGPRHAELRRAFGEGVAASPGKASTVELLADTILRAAEANPETLRRARVWPQSLAAIPRLLGELRGARGDAVQLAQERRTVRKALGAKATRRKRPR